MLDNYSVLCTNRTNKRVGGFMMYVRKNLKHIVRPKLSEAIDDINQSISVELEIDNGKNIIITCLYRAPGTNLELFNEHIDVLLNKVNLNKKNFTWSET